MCDGLLETGACWDRCQKRGESLQKPETGRWEPNQRGDNGGSPGAERGRTALGAQGGARRQGAADPIRIANLGKAPPGRCDGREWLYQSPYSLASIVVLLHPKCRAPRPRCLLHHHCHTTRPQLWQAHVSHRSFLTYHVSVPSSILEACFATSRTLEAISRYLLPDNFVLSFQDPRLHCVMRALLLTDFVRL
jgi:hypothetical protein